jgi:hypothetical protein
LAGGRVFLIDFLRPEVRLAVLQSSDGSKQLLERLQQRPGFDNEAVIKAMGPTSSAKFVCWKRQAA